MALNETFNTAGQPAIGATDTADPAIITMPCTQRFSKGQMLLLLVAFICLLSCPLWAQGDPLAMQPDRFKFNHPYGPDPGWRSWERNGANWTELLPSKNKGNFKVRKAFTLKGVHGALLAKVEEPDFFVFIPNITNLRTGKMQLWCVKGAKGTWILLGNMTDVSPGIID